MKKRILLGVCAGAAIYKICYLVRVLLKNDFELKVVMTKDATKLLSPMLFEALGVEVEVDLFQKEKPLLHIKLAEWPNLVLVAPATLNTLSKLCAGIADNLLLTIIFALPSKIPVVFCPSMNENMWKHPLFQENLKRLKEVKNYKVIEPQKGVLASGKIGKGRMPEPEDILKEIKKILSQK
jgi:phosphopantothenoylcysteine decarboxylase/phosphopantothenate--cysteine ligase